MARFPKDSLIPNRRKRIDPEPIGIAVSVAGIVGGLAGAVSLYRDFNRTRFRRSHRAAVTVLNKVQPLLTGIERDLAQMEHLIDRSLSIDLQSIWLGSRVLMVPAHFSEYARIAEGLLPKLRKVLKASHRLERIAVRLPYVDSQTNRSLVNLNLKIETVMTGRHRPATEILGDVAEVVKQSRAVVQQLFAELGGQHSDEK